MGYTRKPLESLDLMDDFLMNAVTTDREVSEPFCKRVLSVLLQREVGRLRIVAQRTLPAPAPNMRGIRMDVEIEEYEEGDAERGVSDRRDSPVRVYDLEPHLSKDIDLPRHNRFYQAKIDSRYLQRGERDFSGMPELYVITITNYDPFGYDYMMYTMRNSCRELPELWYDDGLSFLYFYTGGTKGGNREIKTMLNYFSESSQPNAVDEATREIHEYIRKVKISQEVQIEYMKYDDLVYLMKKEGRAEGKAEGKAEGRAEAVIELLEELGALPEELKEEILTQTDLETLKQWHLCAARAQSLEEWNAKRQQSEGVLGKSQ